MLVFLAKRLQVASLSMGQLSANASAAVGPINAVASAMQGINAAATTAASASGASGTQTNTTSQGAYVNQQLALLKGLSAEIAKVGGADATGKYGFATMANDIIAKVERGDMSITDGIQELQRMFGSVYGVIQKQLFDPNSSPEMRALDRELELFINSGNLNS